MRAMRPRCSDISTSCSTSKPCWMVRRQRYQLRGDPIVYPAENGPPVDWVAALATVASELHHAFEYFHWTGTYALHPEHVSHGISGFYRTVAPDMLAIGPYQGTHGCLHIPFSKGVCGAAARTATTQCVDDVHAFPGHIACASTYATK